MFLVGVHTPDRDTPLMLPHRSILHPPDAEQSFVNDSLIFIAIMLVICLGLFAWAAVTLVSVGASGLKVFIRFLDMITTAVPPALPACLAIATVLSINRLRRRSIYVTSPERVAMAGQLDVICFDKTGTDYLASLLRRIAGPN